MVTAEVLYTTICYFVPAGLFYIPIVAIATVCNGPTGLPKCVFYLVWFLVFFVSPMFYFSLYFFAGHNFALSPSFTSIFYQI